MSARHLPTKATIVIRKCRRLTIDGVSMPFISFFSYCRRCWVRIVRCLSSLFEEFELDYTPSEKWCGTVVVVPIVPWCSSLPYIAKVNQLNSCISIIVLNFTCNKKQKPKLWLEIRNCILHSPPYQFTQLHSISSAHSSMKLVCVVVCFSASVFFPNIFNCVIVKLIL